MFSLFTSQKNSPIEIVKPGRGMTRRMGELIRPRQERLDALGEEHGNVDMRLVEKISALLDPLIGPEGSDQEAWFHSMDFYGDGVRHLEFKPGKFPMAVIPALQALLVGEHEPFSILCWAPVGPEMPPEHQDGLVVFSDKLLITSRLAATSTVIQGRNRTAGV